MYILLIIEHKGDGAP